MVKNLLSPKVRKLKVMIATKMKHKISSQKPNAELAATYMNQALVWQSWCLSNSSLKMSWAPKALMVVKPCNVAFKCVNAGLLTVQNHKC